MTATFPFILFVLCVLAGALLISAVILGQIHTTISDIFEIHEDRIRRLEDRER